MALTEEQLKTYREDGCVIIPDFFNEKESLALRSELDRFVKEGLIRNVATDGDGETVSKTKANLQLIPLWDKSDLYRALPWSPKVVQAVTQILGDAWCRWLDQIFLKPAHHGAGTGWHQDNAYFKRDDATTGVGMWTALHDATRANGTMEVIPKSHLTEYEHARDLGSNHHITAKGVDESKAIAVEVPAGGVIFFNYGVMHCTRANNTDKPRAGMAYHFLRTDAVDESHNGQAFFVCGKEATGGEKEFGVNVEGTWDNEVEKTLKRNAVQA